MVSAAVHSPRSRRPLLGPFIGLAGLVMFSAACAPAIGDDCETSIDCSVNGDRICDRAQPGGYCTVLECAPDTCPDNALCVEWRGDPGRTAVRYCMQHCDDSSDCRDNYGCFGPTDPELREEPGNVDTASLAVIVDLDPGRRNAKFCAVNVN